MLVLAALWGSSYMFIKVAIDGGLSDTFIVFARTLLGAAVLAPVMLGGDTLGAVRRRFGWLVVIALMQVVGPFLLITIGEHHVPSSLAGILIASAPIWTALIVLFAVKEERLRGIGVVGTLVGIVGVALLFGVDLSGDPDALLAGAGILLAGLGYAGASVLAKRKVPDVPPVGIAGTITAISALVLLPTVPFDAPAELPSLGTVASIVVLGAGSSGLAFLIYYTLNAEIGPSRASLVAYIAPVFSVLYGVTLLGEELTVGIVAGLTLILAGSWLAADGRMPRRRRRQAALAETPASPA